MVAIARPLLANPDLLDQLDSGADKPLNPCSFCSAVLLADRRASRSAATISAVSTSLEEMTEQIIALSLAECGPFASGRMPPAAYRIVTTQLRSMLAMT